MKQMDAADFATDIDRLIAEIEASGEVIIVRSTAGRAIAAIPASWYIPAGDPLPDQSLDPVENPDRG